MTAPLLTTVLDCLGDAIPGELDIGPDTPLLDLGTLDSLAIAEVTAAVEAASGVELAPELLVPASYATPRALAAAFEASAGGTSYAEHLPCVEANLEVLVRRAGVEDVLTLLGGPCGLAAAPPDRLELRPVDLAEWIARWTGLRLVRDGGLERDALVDRVRTLAAAGTPALVFADAFTVPWNPYAGHEHHEHAFVVDDCDEGAGRVHVVDAYTNATPYGHAAPRREWMAARELAAALRPHGRGFAVAHLEGSPREPGAPLVAIVSDNVSAYEQAAAAGAGADALTAHLPAAPGPQELHWLTLATWLVARSRSLHALWWRTGGLPGGDGVAEFGEQVAVPAWRAAQTSTYLASRRVAAGRACPPAARDALAAAARADREWFSRMRDWLGDRHA